MVLFRFDQIKVTPPRAVILQARPTSYDDDDDVNSNVVYLRTKFYLTSKEV